MIESSVSFRHVSFSRKNAYSSSILYIRGINTGDMEEDTESSEGIIEVPTKNVLGGRLQACCFSPKTGFYRVSR